MKYTDNLSDHFTYYELIRSETAARLQIDNHPPPEYVPRLRRLATHILEPVRAHFDRPFRPNSGYRSRQLNRAIGSSDTSQHILAQAVDIEIPGVSNHELATWIRDHLIYDKLILECYRQGTPNSGWVHISVQPYPTDNRRQTLTYADGRYLAGLVA